MSVELTINGNAYKTGRLTAKQQFHVARRLLPVVSALATAAASAPKAPDAEVGVSIDDNNSLITTLSDSMSRMPDKDCDYVLSVCLSCCQRQQPSGGWANVWNVAADQAQFADIDLSVMIQLVMATLQDNIGSFTAALPQAFPATNRPANVPLNS